MLGQARNTRQAAHCSLEVQKSDHEPCRLPCSSRRMCLPEALLLYMLWDVWLSVTAPSQNCYTVPDPVFTCPELARLPGAQYKMAAPQLPTHATPA